MAHWKQKRTIMKRYDHSASVYDAQYHEEQKAKINAALRQVHLGKKEVLMDVGCGTGQLLPYVTSSVDSVLCVDISRNLIMQAKTRAVDFENVALLRADADHLPLKSSKFDIVFAVTLLQNMPNPIQTLSEMKRVTRESGRLVVTGLRKSFNEQHFRELLKHAGLGIGSLELDAAQREYVAVCANVKENLNRTPKAL